MRRLFIALVLVMLLGSIAQAQTTVNLSVTDTPDNQTWNNGTWAVQLIPGPGNLDQTRNFTLLVAGGSLGSQSGSLSATGTVSMALPANVNIGPVGTKWQFTVCSQQGTACSISNVTVTTSSPQSVALTPPSIRVSAAPNLPPIVVYTTTEISSASIGSQITVVGTTPSTPALQTCTAVTGSTCTTWAAAGGGISGSYGPSAFSCSGCNPNVQYAFTVTCNNLSSTITTGVNDPPFTAADVGKIIVGVTQGNLSANCPPQGTITAFNSAHSVTVSNAATATTTTGSLAWGSQDDGSNLQTAFAASLGKGCFYLPAGAMFISVPPFIDSRSTSATGYPACIIGQANTVLTPLPGFNYANCTTANACIFTWSNGSGTNPNYAYLSNLEVFGLQYTLTGTGTAKTLFNFSRVTAENIWVWGWGTGLGSAYTWSAPDSAFGIVDFLSGNTGMTCSGSGQAGGQVTIEQGYIGGGAAGGGVPLSVGAGCILVTSKLIVQNSTTSPVVSVSATNGSGGWYSYGDIISAPTGTGDTVRLNSGTVSMHDDFVNGSTSNTLGAVDCNGSGANFLLYNTTIIGGSGGLAARSVAGCNLNNADGQSTVPQGTLSLSGNNFSAARETQTGTCAANAATVTFKLTPYIAAPLVLVSDTTSGSTGAQATATSTTTATIHCNGATDTFVATVIPNPI